MPGIIISICLFFVFVFAFVSVSRAQAMTPKNGERLIVIHEDDKDRGILTRAGTLRQAFKEANVHIDPRDIVEPGLDDELVASHYEVNIYRARPVVIADGAIRHKIMTPYQTPEQIAKDAEITLQKEDIATLSANTDMVSEGSGLQMSIQRATPFMLLFYGTKTPSFTQGKTVGEMFEQKGVTLGPDDTVSLSLDTPITKDMTVELWRNGKQTATFEEQVPFEIEQVKDADREVGYRQVKSVGVPGVRTVTYEILRADNREVSRTEIQSLVTKEPIKQVEIVGTKQANTFNGSFAEALARLRSCEGSYTSNTGNGYYGAYQFDRQTWGNYGGYAVASDAPPTVQDEKAWLTYQRRGWQPWPSCKIKMGLQDIYR